MKKKKMVLWKKQREFLEACMGSKKSVGEVMDELGISNKLLALWMTRPAFLHHYRKARRFLVQRRELDLVIGATRGADLLNRGLSSESKQEKPAVEMIKLARDRGVRKKRKRLEERRLAHPDHSEEEVERLLEIVEGREGAD